MKIYFCDICNESIPLKDINSNRITIEEGKIFCQKCAPKKAKVRDKVAGPVLGLLLLLLLGGVVLALYGWKVASDLRGDLDAQAAKVAQVEGRTEEALTDRMQQVRGDLEQVTRKVDDFDSSTKTALSEIRRLLSILDKREGDHHRGVLESLDQKLADLQQTLQKDVEELRGGQQNLRVSLKGMEVEIQGVKSKMKFVEDLVTSRLPTAAPGTDVPAPPPETPAPSSDGGGAGTLADREINGLIAQLSDEDAGKRYSAVVELASYGGDRVVKALEGVLADSEAFVRVAVVQNLRKLGVLTSIPHIITMLRDPDYFVRVAANSALTAMTSQELGYDPDAAPKQREGKVKEWLDWWETNKARLLKASK